MPRWKWSQSLVKLVGFFSSLWCGTVQMPVGALTPLKAFPVGETPCIGVSKSPSAHTTLTAWSILKTNSQETNRWFPLRFNILCTISNGWCNIIQKFTWCGYFWCWKWLSLFLFSSFQTFIGGARAFSCLCVRRCICGYVYVVFVCVYMTAHTSVCA